MEEVSRRDSGLSDYDLTGFVEQEETSSVAENIEWTDEKHTLYLKSMEASFVEQLYNLKDIFSGYPSSQNGFNEKLNWQGSLAESSKVKVQQHCRLAKKLRKTAPQPELVDASGKILINPLNKYLKSGGSSDAALSYRNISELCTNGKHNQVSFSLNEECSGQNFKDEYCENGPPRRQREKRLRNQDTLDEINDQVVPFGISCLPMQDRNEGCFDYARHKDRANEN